MNQLTIGVFYDDSLAKELGKKATESDIVFYHRKSGDTIFSFIHPFEDKIIPKSQILNMIDVAIISAEKITPALGETILMIDSLNIKNGLIIFPPYTDTSQLLKLIEGTSLASYKMVKKNVQVIFEYLKKMKIERNLSGPAITTVDHAFHVKGVGEIVLGFVSQGVLQKHDKLMVYPVEKKTTIRSIQIQDMDYDAASAGSRVGLSLKGMTVDELKRGSVLSPPDIFQTGTQLRIAFSKNRFYPKISIGRFHATIGLQSVPININEVTDDVITLSLEKQVCFTKSQKVILLDLNAEKLHHMGTGIII